MCNKCVMAQLKCQVFHGLLNDFLPIVAFSFVALHWFVLNTKPIQ